jgi:hypothetical protein
MRCGRYFFDPHPLYSPTKLFAINRIPIPQQEAWNRIFGKSFDLLLCGPSSSRMFGQVEVKGTSPIVQQNEETVRYAKPHCRDGEEID